MTCLNPLDGWRSREPNENGKYPVVFNPRKGYEDQYIPVPCGKCEGCRVVKTREWGIRCFHESLLHERNAFLTLTYDDANLPEDGKLKKDDLKKFIQLLKKQYKIRYFGVGEYGEKTNRPHYHAIIFGEDFLGGAHIVGEEVFNEDVLSKWGKGMVVTKPLIDARACFYTAGYCVKKVTDPDTFNYMSHKPAIGKAWVQKYHEDWTRTGMCVIDGVERPIPAKYMEWFGMEFDEVRDKQKAYLASQEPLSIREYRRSREKNLKAKNIGRGGQI